MFYTQKKEKASLLHPLERRLYEVKNLASVKSLSYYVVSYLVLTIDYYLFSILYLVLFIYYSLLVIYYLVLIIRSFIIPI